MSAAEFKFFMLFLVFFQVLCGFQPPRKIETDILLHAHDDDVAQQHRKRDAWKVSNAVILGQADVKCPLHFDASKGTQPKPAIRAITEQGFW